MRIVRSSSLIMLLAAGFSLFQSPAISAPQRPAEMGVPYGEMEQFLSPTELQLAELQRERQDLLQSRESEKNVRILKNKITILNNKIAYLQRQVKLTKPYVVTTRLVPIKPKGAADNAEHISAVSVWNPNIAQPKPAAPAAQRLQAAEAAVPAPKAVPVAVIAPVKIAAPVVPPISLSTLSFSKSERREGAQTAELPRRLAPVTSMTSAARETAAAQTLPEKLDVRPFAPASTRLAAALAPAPAPASSVITDHKPSAAKTGAQWKKMALADKEIYILSVMGNLSRRDVYLMKPYSFYIQAIDEAIAKNPLLEKEFIHRILMMSAYDSEPDTRKDLEKVWK